MPVYYDMLVFVTLLMEMQFVTPNPDPMYVQSWTLRYACLTVTSRHLSCLHAREPCVIHVEPSTVVLSRRYAMPYSSYRHHDS